MNELKHIAKFNNELGNITISNEGVRFEGAIHNFTWDEFSFHAVITKDKIIIQHLTDDKKKIYLEYTSQLVEFIKSSDLSCSESYVSRSGLKEYKRVAFYFVAFFLIVTGSFQAIRYVSSKYVTIGSIQEEIEFSKTLYDEYLESKVLLGDDSRVLKLKLLANILLDKVNTEPFKINLYIIEEDFANAFADPGGNIVFTTKFLQEAKTPEEVLGVLAHELAHIKLRHPYRRMEQEKYVSAFKTIFFAESFFTNMGEVISGLTYSRKDEKNADEQALEYLKKAKISASGIANFFERRDDFEIKWLSTHPLSSERIKKFKRHLRNESQLSSVNFDMKNFD